MSITLCHTPSPVTKLEADLYLKIREAHCASKERDHPCLGVVTIGPSSVILQCPKCGDYKGLVTKNPPCGP
jgi:hypothetical protein